MVCNVQGRVNVGVYVPSVSSPGKKERVRHDIIMEILKTANGNGTRKTKIMYDVNLSFGQLQKYLPALKEAGLVTEQSGIWKTTEKGFGVMEACTICNQLIKEISRTHKP